MDDTGFDPSYPYKQFLRQYHVIYRCVTAPQANGGVSLLYLFAQVIPEVPIKLDTRVCVCVSIKTSKRREHYVIPVKGVGRNWNNNTAATEVEYERMDRA